MLERALALRRSITPPGWATLAAMLMALGFGVFHAVVAGPWVGPDERAHTGYVMALSRGVIPRIDSPIEIPPGATDLETLLAIDRASRDGGEVARDTSWVANHPPGAYLPALPGTILARVTGNGTSVLLWLRLTNVGFFVVAVGLTALVARELTDSPWTGALAAAITANVPYALATTSLAMTDGATLAAMLAVMLATMRASRLRWQNGSLSRVTLACMACGLVRISALATAVGVVGLAFVAEAVRHRSLRLREAIVIATATALSSGWFYALNVARYGDAAASRALLGRFDRSPNGSMLEAATDVPRGLKTLYTLAAGRVDRSFNSNVRSPWPDPALIGRPIIAVAVVAALMVGWAVTRGHLPRRFLAWTTLLVAVGLNWLMMAQHVSGGGLPHARYALIVVSVMALVIATACTTTARIIDASITEQEVTPRRPASRCRPAAAWLVQLTPFAVVVTHNLMGLGDVVDLTILHHLDLSQFDHVRLGPRWMALPALAAAGAGALGFVVFSWRQRHPGLSQSTQ